MKVNWKAHAHLTELNWRRYKSNPQHDYLADVRILWYGTLYGCLQKYRKSPKIEVTGGESGWQNEFEVLVDKEAGFDDNFLRQDLLDELLARPDFPIR